MVLVWWIEDPNISLRVLEQRSGISHRTAVTMRRKLRKLDNSEQGQLIKELAVRRMRLGAK